MKEPLTTYTVQGSNTSIVWQFKYRLNGLLYEFKLLEGELDQKQIQWLFVKGFFPYKEKQIKGWIKSIKNFKIEIGEPDLSFDTFWNLYAEKQKKLKAIDLWKKLSKADKINAIKYIRRYNNILRTKNQAKALPDTYLRQKRWLDEL